VSLPPSDLVLADLPATDTAEERFPGRQSALQVFRVYLDKMAWRPLGERADVIVGNIRSEDLVDALAEFLCRFRNLSNDRSDNASS
jgi:hypothetical protein